MSYAKNLAPMFFLFSGLAMADEGVLLGNAAETKWNALPIESEWADDGWTWREDSEWLCKKYYDTDLNGFFFECYEK